ncbi:UNVERIFIED_CONTAM: 3-phosphoinositide dependent protein kinase-1 [Siphonaria sp. JEL0065]|nr:3-phosphoinositide dependent protein kinase-1 [Siphonaria sp. JEL0065]
MTTPPKKREPKDFTFGRVLGEGSYASVVKATEKATGRLFAIKVLDQKFIIKENKVKYVFIERDVLNATNHPFIVKLFYTFQSSSSLYFAMELASNGDLLGLLRTRLFSKEAATFYTAEIISAIEYLHSCGILHRDLKPENILITENYHIKLCDFGSAKILPKDPKQPEQESTATPTDPSSPTPKQQNSFVGTAEYCSPELLNDRLATPASDIWAIGCIFFYLHANRPPFKGGNDYQTFQKILGLKYDFPVDKDFPDDARSVVKRILVLDPKSRIGISELKEMEYFKGIGKGEGGWEEMHLRNAPELPNAPNNASHLVAFSEDELASWYGKSLNVEAENEGKAKSVVPAVVANNAGIDSPLPSPDSSEESIQYPYEKNDGIEGVSSPEFLEIEREIMKLDPNQQRQDALASQRSSVLAPLLKENELVLMVGTVGRRSGVFTKKSGLMLTDLPRLAFFDAEKFIQQKDIPWNSELQVESKDNRNFIIRTPKKTYHLKDLEQHADKWVEAIRKCVAK